MHVVIHKSGLALALGLMLAPPAMAARGGPSPRLPELSVRWWQWAFSFPADANPLTDTAGCGVGQSGHVWFLGGSLNTSDPVNRTCTIPVGTFILVPALNAECSTIEGDGTTEAALRACANGLIEGASGTATVDGEPVKVVRAESPLFSFSLPATTCSAWVRRPATRSQPASGR